MPSPSCIVSRPMNVTIIIVAYLMILPARSPDVCATIFETKFAMNKPAPIITAPRTTRPPTSRSVLKTFVSSGIPKAFIAAVKPIRAIPMKPTLAITLDGTKFDPVPSRLAIVDSELSTPSAGNVFFARLDTKRPMYTNIPRMIPAPMMRGM